MNTPARYGALDGWRGLCALMVATYHYPKTFGILHWSPFSAGWIFVDFFFVLSGLVITHRYLQSAAPIDLRTFVAARLRRLYPGHFIILLATICVAMITIVTRYQFKDTVRFDELGASRSGVAVTIASHLWLVQGFGAFANVGLNIPSWSISVEFWTNIIFAILAQARQLRIAPLLFIVLACTLLLATLDPVDYLSGSAICNMARSIQGFAIGAVVCKLLQYDRFPASQKYLATAMELSCLALLLIATMLGSRLCMVWALPFAFGICVYIFANEGGAVSSLLGMRAFQRMGQWSYAIYLVHSLWVGLFYSASVLALRTPALSTLADRLGPSVVAPSCYLLYIAAVLCSAALLSSLVDRQLVMPRLISQRSPA